MLSKTRSSSEAMLGMSLLRSAGAPSSADSSPKRDTRRSLSDASAWCTHASMSLQSKDASKTVQSGGNSIAGV